MSYTNGRENANSRHSSESFSEIMRSDLRTIIEGLLWAETTEVAVKSTVPVEYYTALRDFI